jgi:hypothetical protein
LEGQANPEPSVRGIDNSPPNNGRKREKAMNPQAREGRKKLE